MNKMSDKTTWLLPALLICFAVQQDVNAQSLRELALKRQIDIGANFPLLVDGKPPNNWRDSPTIQIEKKIAAEHFTIMSAGWQMYPGHTWKGPGEYDFAGSDEFIEWCHQNRIRVHGHGLGYASRVDWLKKLQAKTVEQRLEIRQIYESYVLDTASHFAGRVHMWDVCNEQLLPAYVFRGYQTNQSYWQAYVVKNQKPESGVEWYRQTFRLVRKSDPDSSLILLDFNNEIICPKSDMMYDLAKQLKNEGIPLDGVGFQMHLRTDLNRSKGHGFKTDQEYFDSFSANLKRFSDLDLDVWITELDVSIDPKNDMKVELHRQADVYAAIVNRALSNSRLRGIKFWGITDRDTWGRVIPERPNLFDEDGNPKDAFLRVQAELKLEQ